MKTKRSRVKDGVVVAKYPSSLTVESIENLQTGIDSVGYAKTVTTEDGRECSSTSETWRRYCEACFMLRLSDKSDKRKQGWKAISKRDQLENVRQKRGEQAYLELRAEMLRIYEYRK